MTAAARLMDVEVGASGLPGCVEIPSARAIGVVIFAHGSGSSRMSPRNRWVAARLHQAGFATVLFDLLTDAEALDRSRVFDIDLLALRLVEAIDWAARFLPLASLPCGLFGASTGAAAAVVAAAQRPEAVRALVSRGGRADLAGVALSRVRAPTLLIVGGADDIVLQLNRGAFDQLRCPKQLAVVARATHLFEEPGAIERVADLAADWFVRYLPENRND